MIMNKFLNTLDLEIVNDMADISFYKGRMALWTKNNH